MTWRNTKSRVVADLRLRPGLEPGAGRVRRSSAAGIGPTVAALSSVPATRYAERALMVSARARSAVSRLTTRGPEAGSRTSGSSGPKGRGLASPYPWA